MMHIVIAVPASDKDNANLAAPSFGTFAAGDVMFGEGQKRIHRTTGAVWYAACTAAPLVGTQALRDYCFGRDAVAARDPGTDGPDDPGAPAITAMPAAFPSAMIEEFSLEHNPGYQQTILDQWELDVADE